MAWFMGRGKNKKAVYRPHWKARCESVEEQLSESRRQVGQMTQLLLIFAKRHPDTALEVAKAIGDAPDFARNQPVAQSKGPGVVDDQYGLSVFDLSQMSEGVDRGL